MHKSEHCAQQQLQCHAKVVGVVGTGESPAIPLAAGLPVGLGWLKLQARLKRDGRLDQLPGVGKP